MTNINKSNNRKSDDYFETTSNSSDHEIDAYTSMISDIKSMTIPMPDNLDSFVEETLSALPKRKVLWRSGVINVSASFAAVILILSMLITASESFASFAKEVPGLSYLVNLLTTDVGSEGALLNGYPIKETMVFKDGEYELTIEHMMIDEERLTFNAYMRGPEFDLNSQTEFGQSRSIGVTDESDEEEDFEMSAYDYEIRLLDGQGVSSSTYDDEGYGRKISMSFNQENEDFMIHLIETDMPLVFTCNIYERTGDERHDIYEFKAFSIPVFEEDILKTRHIEAREVITLDQGILNFDTLEISPSNMKLIGSETPNDGIQAIGLKGIKVSSESGQEFQTPMISRLGNGQGTAVYNIIPSIYFEDYDWLEIAYEAYYYSLDHDPYTLDIKDDYPKTYDYYGNAFTIQDISRMGDELQITFTTENEEVFTLQDLDFEGFDQNHSGQSTSLDDDGNEKIERYSYIENFGDQTQFSFDLSYPKIYVPKSGSFTIDLRE